MRNSLCKILEKLKIDSSFLQIGCEKTYSRLTHENASKGVFQQNIFGFLEKTHNTKMLSKDTFKNI